MSSIGASNEKEKLAVLLPSSCLFPLPEDKKYRAVLDVIDVREALNGFPVRLITTRRAAS